MIFVYNVLITISLLIIPHNFHVVKKKEILLMKICTIISEYNPFHFGHKYQIDEIRKNTGADCILAVMSGNFTQRGETAVLQKYTRAKHAVENGVDAVIELPFPFATSSAEIFARGGIKIAKALQTDLLSFGAEETNPDFFYDTAKLLLNEPKVVSEKIKRFLKDGDSFIVARQKAYGDLLPSDLMKKPNTVLGIEYVKAMIEQDATFGIFPVLRKGNAHTDTSIGDFPSSTAIRTAIANGQTNSLEGKIPENVFRDLKSVQQDYLLFFEKLHILTDGKDFIKRLTDYETGIENAMENFSTENAPLDDLVSKRYTRSRIQRLLLHNLVGLDDAFIKRCLAEPLYLNLLAVNHSNKSLLSYLGHCDFPLLVRPHDKDKLVGTAKELYDLTEHADQIYHLARDFRAGPTNPLI